jgi:hypothetical protein
MTKTHSRVRTRVRTFDGGWRHSPLLERQGIWCQMINPSGSHCHLDHEWTNHPGTFVQAYVDQGWWKPCSIPKELHARN